MKTTIARLFRTVIIPVALLAGAAGCDQDAAARRATVVEVAPAGALDCDAPLVPQNRRDLAIYSARTQGESRTEVFVRAKSDATPHLVYVDPEPGELVRVNADGTRGVYRRYLSPGKFADFTIDLQRAQS